MPLEVRTDVDVVTEALRALVVISGDEEPAGFERDNTLARWHELHADLADDGLIEFPSDAVPLEAFRACWSLLADAIAAGYGRAPLLGSVDDPMHPMRTRLQRRISASDDGETRPIVEF